MIKHKRREPWYQRSVLYQIYPLSWSDANGDGYGDIRGIINHLDYLNDGTAESLGVGAIWLSPVYRSGMADWGYDVIDHCSIDPIFGNMADFDELVYEVHRRGMKLLMDFVPNHTSIEHAWFKESRSSRDSAKRDWYIWANSKSGGGVPNNWLSQFGGSMWTLDETTGQYYLHTFLPEQPDLNWRNPEVREAMLEVLRFWLRRGVDGFRADAVTALLKDEALRDDPPNPDYRPGVTLPVLAHLPVYSHVQAALPGIVGSFCDALAEHEDTFMVSEAYLNITALRDLYGACPRHPIHAPFNFNLMLLDWNAEVFRQFIDEYEAALGPHDWPNYVLGNHDNPRLASRLGQERARLAAFLQLTLRGLPVIYYGDELGMENAVISTTKARDTKVHPQVGRLMKRDRARSPMAWSDAPAAEFTTGKPWLPLPPDYVRHNVLYEEQRPDSMLAMYRRLIHLRDVCIPLARGTYRSLAVGNPNVLVFVREAPEGKCYSLLNFSSTKQDVIIGKIGSWIAGTHDIEGDGLVHEAGVVTLAPFEGRLYEILREKLLKS